MENEEQATEETGETHFGNVLGFLGFRVPLRFMQYSFS
jgi:hypothetical protein